MLFEISVKASHRLEATVNGTGQNTSVGIFEKIASVIQSVDIDVGIKAHSDR